MMKQLLISLCAVAAIFFSLHAVAQELGVEFSEAVETVVTVRGVHYVNRTVTVETQDGTHVKIKVPEEAQNLYQVHPGSQFRIRYAQAVAVGLLAPGEEPSAGTGEAIRMAAKGENPGGMLVSVTEISGEIEAIDHADRLVLVRGPLGKLREFAVSDMFQGFESLQVGDVVGLRVTEALAMEMIKQ